MGALPMSAATPATSPSYRPGLHAYAALVVLVAAGVIYIGGYVTSIQAGLAVPDWPLSFGTVNPTGWWHNLPVRAEHGHRLAGATLGLLALGLWAWVWRVDEILTLGLRTWVRRTDERPRWLVTILVAALLVQGFLGGLRVVEKSIPFAIVHGCLAQAIFVLVVGLCWTLSRGWLATGRPTAGRADRAVALALVGAVYVQVIVAALMRQQRAGLAIETFPLVNGQLWPDVWTLKVTLHYLHRVVALLIAGLALVVFLRSLAERVGRRARLAAWLCFAGVLAQILLGAVVIFTRLAVVPTTAHVLLGASILAASASHLLWVWHGEEPLPVAAAPASSPAVRSPA